VDFARQEQRVYQVVHSSYSNTPISVTTLTILVKTPSGNVLPVHVYPSTTVLQLKYQITTLLGVFTQDQRLIFAGKELEDHNCLSFYNISCGDTFHLLLRLRGG